ncbi:MAG: hypothetical protein DRR06_12505, partial [Gammaproteobacteria bacterium]
MYKFPSASASILLIFLALLTVGCSQEDTADPVVTDKEDKTAEKDVAENNMASKNDPLAGY